MRLIIATAVLFAVAAGPATANSRPHSRVGLPNGWAEMATTPARMDGAPPAGNPVYWRNGQRIPNCASRVVPEVRGGQVIGHTRGFFCTPDQD